MGAPRIDFLSNSSNMFDNSDMVISQRYSGATQSGVTASTGVVDRWRTGILGAWTYRHEQRGTGRPLVSDGISHPINNYLQIKPDATKTPTGSDNFGIFTRLESYRTMPYLFRRVKIGFLVRTNKPGTYTAAFYHATNTSVKYFTSFTIIQSGVWEKVVLEVDFTPMHNLTSVLFDFDAGLQMNIFLSCGPDVTGVDTPDQWVSTAAIGGSQARAIAGQVNFFDNTANEFNITGFRSIPLDYAGQEVDLWATLPRDYASELQICQRYYWQMPVNGAGLTGFRSDLIAYNYATSNIFRGNVITPVPMRAAPVIGSVTGDAAWPMYELSSPGTFITFTLTFPGSGYLNNGSSVGFQIAHNNPLGDVSGAPYGAANSRGLTFDSEL